MILDTSMLIKTRKNMNLRFIQKQYKAFPVFSDFALKSIFCSQKISETVSLITCDFYYLILVITKLIQTYENLNLHVMQELYSDRKLNGNKIPVFSDFVSKSTVFAPKSRKRHMINGHFFNMISDTSMLIKTRKK